MMYSKFSRSKFGARKTCGYDSRKEHNRAIELKLLARAGAISNLQEQVSYVLIPMQKVCVGKDLQGKPIMRTERSCSYVADFVYTDNATGETIVEDTKGVRTAEYIIKRKLMLAVHGIAIRET